MLDRIDIILHRPQASENVGAVARAMKNFGLKNMVLVSPPRFEPARARTLAVHAGEIVDGARRCLTLDDALAPCTFVIPTTERALEGRPPPLTPREAAMKLLERAGEGRVALLFGEEARGLSNELIERFADYSSIPANPERRSLNLAQAALLYFWELYQESTGAPARPRPDEATEGDGPAPLKLVTLLRERARKLFLANGFLNPQQPDGALDELMRLLQRANPTRRELELVLAALSQLERTSTARPV